MACVGLGIARNRKAPANAETLNRCAVFLAVSQRPFQRRRPNASISLFQSRATLQACEVRVHGLPALFPYVALSGYRRPGLPEGCPGYR